MKSEDLGHTFMPKTLKHCVSSLGHPGVILGHPKVLLGPLESSRVL